MRFWRKRKQTLKSKTAALSIEQLEDRAMMATIPIVSGQATTFRDGDGTEVKVTLVGPGSGAIELMNGVLDGAAIDSIVLNGTSGQSKFKITTKGGAVHGATINELVITKALNELGALKHLKAKHIDFTDGGQLVADGNIEQIHIRSLGDDADLDVTGNVNKLKIETVNSDAKVEVSGKLREFVAALLASGAEVVANQIDLLKVKEQAQGATFDIGDGGLAQAKFKHLYNSSISADGSIGKVKIKGDAIASIFASNIDAGSDGTLGTIDDYVVDPSVAGNINSIKFTGRVGTRGTSDQVQLVTSGVVGQVKLGSAAIHSGGVPKKWEQAAQEVMPLSIIQAYSEATGYDDDNIWISVFGTDSLSGNTYYLSADNINANGVPILTLTGSTASSTTPNLPLVKSYTISDWRNASQTWGSNLAFPIPSENDQWSGRILISVGIPVQAQVNANGTVASPSSNDAIDPSTGTFYDFLEFTASGPAVVNGNNVPANLDIDTSLVDAFGLPMALQLFQPGPTSTQFNGTIDPGGSDILGVVDTTGLAVGQYVAGPGIPAGAIITAISTATPMNPSVVTLNVTMPGPGSGPFTAYNWASYDLPITAVTTQGSNVIGGITYNGQTGSSAVNAMVAAGMGTSQPIVATGVLPAGTTIESYDIDLGQITLTLPAQQTTTSQSPASLSVDPAGPVGVATLRDAIMGKGASSLVQFLQQKISDGHTDAWPFLQSAYPYLFTGPVPIFGVDIGIGAIAVETAGSGVLTSNDYVQISGVLGNTVADGVYKIASATGSSFTLDYPISNGAYQNGSGTWSIVDPATISSMSTTSAVISSSATTMPTASQTVTITGVQGNTAVNGSFVVASAGSGNFTLGGPVGNGTYTSGTGYWYLPGDPTTSVSDVTVVDAPALITTNTTGATTLAVGSVVNISGVQGATNLNGGFVVAGFSPDSITLGGPVGNGPYTNNTGSWSGPNGSSGTITGATNVSTAEITVTSSTPTGLKAGDVVTISGVKGNTAANGSFLVQSVTPTTFTLGSPIGDTYTTGGTWQLGTGPTTAITNASEIGFEIEANTDGMQIGDLVLVSGVGGLTNANGAFSVSSIAANSFTVLGASAGGNYTSGGAWQEVQPITGATNNANAAIQITTTLGSLSNGTVVQIGDVEGNTAANGTFVITSVGTPAGTFTLDSPASTTAYTGSGGLWSTSSFSNQTITGATRGGAVVVTTNTALSGLANGDTVVVDGAAGNTAANGEYTVADVSGASFTLPGTLSNGGYTFGGIAYENPTTTNSITSLTGSGTAQMSVDTDTTALSPSSVILIQGVAGTTSANGLFLIDNLMSNAAGSFSIGAPIGNGNFDNNNWSIAITGATAKPAYVIVTNESQINVGDTITVSSVQGNTSVNGSFKVLEKDQASIGLGAPVGNANYFNGGYWTVPRISSAILGGTSTSGQPVVLTTGNTFGLAANDWIEISDSSGNPSVSGLVQVSAVTSTTITLAGVNGNGTLVTGGTWRKAELVTSTTGSGAEIVITTASTDGINVGGVISISEVGGNTNANGTFIVTAKTATTVTLGSPAGSGAYVTSNGTWTSSGGSGLVTNTTNGGVVELAASNTSSLTEGDLIQVTGVGGNLGANGVFTVADVKPGYVTLIGSQSTGEFTFGGSWKEFGTIPRLVSPKDLVESLGSPQDEGELNNYYNELIDDFFLKYLPSSQSVGGHAGGGETLQLVSTASGNSITYYGQVTNSGTINGGYALRFTANAPSPGPNAFDANTLDVYYPFFTTNAPDADVYTPLFGVEEPPTWIVDLGSQYESATQMLFACDAVFADNAERLKLGMSLTASKVVGDLENLVSGAFNRGIALNDGSTWGDSSTWFQSNSRYNYWVEYWHKGVDTYNDLAYAFAYDDKFGASTNLQISNIGLAQIVLGGWDAPQILGSSMSISTNAPGAGVNQNASVQITATLNGQSPTGFVTFFVNGIPINQTNDSNSAPMQAVSVVNNNGSYTATLTANLPTLPNGVHTYNITAFYSGNTQNLPSVGLASLLVNG